MKPKLVWFNHKDFSIKDLENLGSIPECATVTLHILVLKEIWEEDTDFFDAVIAERSGKAHMCTRKDQRRTMWVEKYKTIRFVLLSNFSTVLNHESIFFVFFSLFFKTKNIHRFKCYFSGTRRSVKNAELPINLTGQNPLNVATVDYMNASVHRYYFSFYLWSVLHGSSG